MMAWTRAVLLLTVLGLAAGQFRQFAGGRKASEDFDCPEDFGYYPHPTDCSKYYVCVFGGALEEGCSNELVYSADLLTCDWPRNVDACSGGVRSPAGGASPTQARATAARASPARATAARASPARASPSRASPARVAPVPARSRPAAARRPAPRPESRPELVRNNLEDQFSGQFARSASGGGRFSAPSASSASSAPSARGRTRSSTRGSAPLPEELAEQARLLGGIARQPSDGSGISFEGDTNKIVTRRQQRLFSPGSSSGRGRFQQSIQNSQERAKATAAPPIRISTLSSFSFGNTGTRFPEREPAPSPSPNFAPRPPPSTFVGSSRVPVPAPSPSPTPATVTVSAVVDRRPSPSPTPASTDVQSYTEPAYVAYVNDTIYDVYYIYDDEEVLYEDEVATDAAPRAPATRRPATTTLSQTTTASSVPRNRRPTSRPQSLRTRPTVRRRVNASRKPPTTTTTATVRPFRKINPSFSSTDGFRKTPTTDLTSTRGSTLGSTLGSTRGSTFGSTRGSTLGSTRGSTLGSTRGSTLDSTRGSSFGSSRGTTLGSTFGSTSGSTSGPSSSTRGSTTASFGSTRTSTRGSTVEETFGSTLQSGIGSSRGSTRGTTERRPAPVKPVSGSRGRSPSSGLRSIDSSNSRRPANGVTYPKKSKNNVRTQTRQKVNVWEHPPWRPAPVYPQPEPDTPAERCDARCQLPDCNCGGTATPGGLETRDTPQLVLLTFDDSVNDLNHGLYKDMFENGRVNPNGCPIASTMYVSHEWTDYKQVQNLYADGHEIASHSISHSFGEQFSTSKWEREIAGQREILAAYGGVRLDDVRGMRAPFLSIGGNRMFKMLYNNNFTYDSSMPVYENKPPSWPYTLDYKIHHDCMIPPCPNKAYPGVWEVPMVMWQDLSGGRCSMVDACSAPATAEEVYKMLIKNFERHYSSNRAVFPLYFHAAWFTTTHHKEGFMAFLDTISKMEDVWMVTNWQAIQWMRDPQPLSTVKSFQPFGCDYPERPARCTKARKCNLWHKSGVRYMTTCQPCPDKYPWTGKTGVSPRPY